MTGPMARGRVGQCPKPAAVFFHQVRTKTVAQCVEYYYTWKKMIKFDCGRAPGLGKGVKRKLDEADPTERKVGDSGARGSHWSSVLVWTATDHPGQRGEGAPTGESITLRRVEGRDPDVISAPSAGHLQP